MKGCLWDERRGSSIERQTYIADRVNVKMSEIYHWRARIKLDITGQEKKEQRPQIERRVESRRVWSAGSVSDG